MNWRQCKLAGTALLLLTSYLTLSAQPSAQVTGLSAFHRSGQTFLTWNEISGEDVTYRVYRSGSPITNVSSATYIGSVDQNSSVNKRDGDEVYYVIQDNGSPLNATTGLMVYTVVSSGNFYYAVTANNGSGENRTVTPDANSLNSPVNETVGLPEPVLQGTDHYVHWVNWQNTPLLPAMGNRPGMAYNFMCRNVEPDMTQILNVGLYGGMNDYTDKVDGISGDEFKLSVDNPPPDLFGPQPVGANDLVNPPNTCWYGYGDNFVPQQTLTSGVVPNYTQLRVIYIVKWVLRTWPQVDPNRVYLTGSSFGGYGSVQLGFAFPNIFAAVWANIPRFDMGGPEWDLENGKALTTRYKNIWGTVQSNLPTTNIKLSYPDYAAANEGYPIYDRLDHLYVASQNPQIDFPVMLLGVGKQDRQAGWNEKPRFANVINASHHQFFMYWENVGHKFSTVVFDSVYKRTQLLKYRLNQSYVAINNLSIDDNPGEGNDLLPGGSVTGEPQGTINGYADWAPSSIVDTPSEYRIKVYLRGSVMDQFADTQGMTTATATLTPRRLQQFPHPPGKQYTYENRRANDNALIASGNVIADANGLIHVTGFQISRDGNILILRPGSIGPANQPPNAVASANPTSGTAPLTVNFTGSNSTDPDGGIASHSWNFGDGTSSTLADPQHTYNSAGNYTATLTVTDNGGLTHSASVGITVTAPAANLPPNAVAAANPTSGAAPFIVNFTGSNSTDPDGSIVSYSWNFGDGTSSTLANPQHTYNSAGSYTATLTVTDNGGLTNSASVGITVTAPAVNQPPNAVAAGSPNSGTAPLTVNFTGSNSTDSDGSIASFSWNFGDGGSSTLANPQHIYNTAGNYTAILTVTDNGGLTDTASARITVTAGGGGNQSPVATISQPVENASFVANTKINYAGDATDPEDGVLPLANFAWRLILPNGSAKLVATGKKSGKQKVTKIGRHSLQCIVKDSQGAADTAEVHFTVAASLAKSGGAAIDEIQPDNHVLEQNRPNPFNPTTTISFYLKEGGHVRLSIYNAVGQKIATPVNRELPAGYHTRTVHARDWPSGIYFYELQVNDFREMKKMVVAK
jgi:PKD repeat protein